MTLGSDIDASRTVRQRSTTGVGRGVAGLRGKARERGGGCYDCLVSAVALGLSPSSSLGAGATSISSLPDIARLKFLTLLPSASPTSGSLLAPKTTSTIRKITISSPIPSCPHR